MINRLSDDIVDNSCRTENDTRPPPVFCPIYDTIHNIKQHDDNLLLNDKEVVVTEKISGISARFTCINDKIFCGYKYAWKKEEKNDLLWRTLFDTAVLDAWLRHHQDLIVYGKITNLISTFNCFVVFDIFYNDQWLSFDHAHKIGDPLSWVPLVYRGLYQKESILSLANNYIKGLIIKPVNECFCSTIGRVQFKTIN